MSDESSKRKVRLGQINYTNVLPVYHFVPKDNPNWEFTTAVPTVLNRLLANGELDVAPISAFSYAEYAKDYVALSGLSVAAKGPVGSIFLFSKYPMDDLHQRMIALTNTSATSVNLLKILLQEHCSLQPMYRVMEPKLTHMLEESDAALLIGDEALYWSRQEHDYHVYDLGLEWHRRTGLPMVFAIWAMRKDFIAKSPELARQVHQTFLKSKKQGLANMDAVIKEAISQCGEDEAFWESYFAKLSHELEGEWVTGAEAYFEAAFRQGLLPRPVRVELWGDII
jgi:chorismate dehydratase